LSAFRLRNGARVWSRRVSSELLAAPVVHANAVYASTLDGWTYRFDERSGKRAWRKRLRATTAPWVSDGALYVARRTRGGEQQIVADAATGEIVRRDDPTDSRYVRDVPRDLGNWPQVWAFEGSRPVVAGGVRYDASGGRIVAADASSGTERWIRHHAERPDERSVSSVAVARSQVVLATREGQLYGLDIDTGYTLWAYDIGHPVVAEPIVANGWVYAGTDNGMVIALQVGDATLDGWHSSAATRATTAPSIPPPRPPRRRGRPRPRPRRCDVSAMSRSSSAQRRDGAIALVLDGNRRYTTIDAQLATRSNRCDGAGRRGLWR
jgi:outer membrane protein assembly factor BamB